MSVDTLSMLVQICSHAHPIRHILILTPHWSWKWGEVAATLPVVFGQQVNVDLWTNVKSTWNNLLETGQLWAFLIGLGMGWWAKSLLP
ncbi:hypothetical protein [Arthrospira platensis]|uniref:Uncharacterized protein n=1 Tax=Limnospira platensis NIES-46 TaxID=1236695 RepID=A0A5M3T6E8_LIMPL|nr:hypothetical protein [Arthrospira platensis]AMW27427.1 hypothetical protein AP285_04935 [Arthrospira platensis YZ]KDR58705.1 hypothetical protein APPUASWS_003550 [Arthrospira platensis str. Paraca]MBD2710685.1 hypothetical protein [Arthrospira platensis FACHB-835]MDF2211004.1 hypothetical protein [Arthrospira platensis NCB002]MDT9183963.1 hypothetical protein [Limnospira sp. PMC 289.06]MDT9297696.1 hypothetical protein [Arthrospira platensis PCC 7345]MDT9310587.1 hypothetical protein [Lim